MEPEGDVQERQASESINIFVKTLKGSVNFASFFLVWHVTYVLKRFLFAGKTLSIVVNSTELVENLKERIQDLDGTPPDVQRLIFEGKQIEDGSTLGDYKIRHESTIHLLLRVRTPCTLDARSCRFSFVADFLSLKDAFARIEMACIWT
jgi:hypothetical protein